MRARLGAAPQRPSWPSVSIVVPTRSARDLLSRLLDGLDGTTDYAPFDVLVVDNASDDDTLQWLRGSSFGFPLRIVSMERNLSFSAACNRGAGATEGELLLFLNNDVEPLEPGWLRRLVASLYESGAALAGAVLVDPALESDAGRRGAVHHRDLCFRPAARAVGALEAAPRGLGTDLAQALGPDRPAAAVTAACALVRRSAFASVGGFCELFAYGKEDVDLCLKLRLAGHEIVAGGSTILLHRRGTTRRTSAVGTHAFQRGNLRLLLERWGPRLRREYALDVDDGRGVWSDGAAGDGAWDARTSYCVIAGHAAHAEAADRLVRELVALGYRARGSTAGMGWLLDDVLVHVTAGRAAPPAVRGRWNVLLHGDGPLPPKQDVARFDVVMRGEPDAQRLVTGVEDELGRRGGAARVQRPGQGPPPPGSRAILVLGMARTGTSATTRLLNLLGADVGPAEKLMAPKATVNAKGFYEHHPLVQVNVALLRRLGGSWRDVPDLTPGWELDPRLDDLRERALQLIAEDFATAALWTFKDPRTSLTLPFWRPLVGEPQFVICHRQPLEVAASLEHRDGLTLEQSLALWERYTASAIAHTQGARRIFVGYDELFDERDAVLEALARFTGRPDLAGSPGVRSEAGAWLDAGLRHHRRTRSELVTEPAVGQRVATLALLLELAVRSRTQEPALAGGRGGGEISDALDAAARASAGLEHSPSIADGAARIDGLEERIAEQTAELSRRDPGRRSRVPPEVGFLFVCGCPRSGTTALTTFLNGDERILLGQERYRRIIPLLEPFHFSEPLFFNPTLRETSWAMPWRHEHVFPGSFRDYRALRERWRRGGVQILGDKAPLYHRHFDLLAERFPAARYVMLLRDLRGVARSYIGRAENPIDHWPAENDHRLAVEHWNEALGAAQRFLEGPHADRLLLVSYADFLGGVPGQLERLYDFLGLQAGPADAERYALVNAEFRRRRAADRPLAADVEDHIASHADFALEAELRALATR